MSIRKSLAYSYLDRYASLMLSIVSSMVIARLLTPQDIGIYSVTMVLLTFLATVRDMGAGGYLVQEKELTKERVRAVWAVQLGLGWFLAIVVLLGSVPAAHFYNEPRMTSIMLVLAANYAVNPFGSLTYAWQIREMRFDALALVRFSSTLVGALVSIYLAWIGMGPISLAIGSFGSTLVNALMAIYFRPKWFPWLPGTKEIKRVLSFGSKSTGASIFQTIGGSAAELLLGKLQSMTATGLFSRAGGFVSMFDRLVMSAISSVAISWFAKQSREEGNITLPFLKATSYVTAVGWSFSLGTIFLAYPAIRIMYGDQWDGAVDLTRLLAAALACGMPAAMCTSALMAVGAVNSVLRVTAVTTVIAVILTAIGASIGLLALGVCVTVASIVRSIFWLNATQKEVQFSYSAMFATLRSSAVVGLAAGVAPAIVFAFFGPTPSNVWSALLLGVAGSVVGFFAMIKWIAHPLLEELDPIVNRLLARN